jgi:hypothetical protein
VRGLVVLAYFFVDWTALIPVVSFGLAGILLFVAVAFHRAMMAEFTTEDARRSFAEFPGLRAYRKPKYVGR